MKTNLIIIIAITILLASCGSEDVQDYKTIYSNTMECTGLSASRPDVIIIPNLLWQFDSFQGFYDIITKKVYLKEKYANNPNTLSHEYIHHLIYINRGNSDFCHNNELFNICAPGTSYKTC